MKKSNETGIATNTLFANSTDCLESPHSKWEKAKASKVVNGRAVKKPANPVFFPDNQDAKLMSIAATIVFPIASIIFEK
tara:strand:- start:6628 stop:6864 length:237 start_codon:yes stop_codon:yes gene_type:complete